MPDGYGKLTPRDDPYGWAMAQIEAIRLLPADFAGFDREGMLEFLEDSAHAMLAKVKSQLINLMAHLTKAACTRNPEVIGHWRNECRNFHQEIVIEYRRSMRKEIDLERLWRYATKRVTASFEDYGEPTPTLPADCPFTLAQLVDEDLDIAGTVETLRARWSGG